MAVLCVTKQGRKCCMTLTTGQTGALLRSRKETKSHVREANISNSAIYYDLVDGKGEPACPRLH